MIHALAEMTDGTQPSEDEMESIQVHSSELVVAAGYQTKSSMRFSA